MTHSEISETIKEGIDKHENLRLPKGFTLKVNPAGCLMLFGEFNGTRCWVYATPFYEGCDGIDVSVETAKAVGEVDYGPMVDVTKTVDAPHMEQIIRLSGERGEELNPSDKHDMAFLWLEKIGPKAEALRELLTA